MLGLQGAEHHKLMYQEREAVPRPGQKLTARTGLCAYVCVVFFFPSSSSLPPFLSRLALLLKSYIHVCVPQCECVHLSAGIYVFQPRVGANTEPGSSSRVICVLNCEDISSPQFLPSFV